MIDASKGFIKDGNKNRLREQDIHRIVDVFTKQLEIPSYSRMVPLRGDREERLQSQPAALHRQPEPEDLQDIDGHLRGGIPNRDIDALAEYWDVCPAVSRPPCSRFAVARLRSTAPAGHRGQARHPRPPAVRRLQSPRLKALRQVAQEKPPLSRASQATAIPRKSSRLSRRLLLTPTHRRHCIDPYDVYQHLMDYWAATMQDDCYLIAADGWVKAAAARDRPGRTRKAHLAEPHDYQGGRGMIRIAQCLLVARYFVVEARGDRSARQLSWTRTRAAIDESRGEQAARRAAGRARGEGEKAEDHRQGGERDRGRQRSRRR